MRQCTAIRRDGGRCKGVAIDACGLCYSHDPNRADARRRAARKGGQRGGRGRPQADLNALKNRLVALGEDVLDGRVDRSDAAVASQCWNAAVGAIRTGLKAREQEELVERIEELERLLDEKQEEERRWGASAIG